MPAPAIPSPPTPKQLALLEFFIAFVEEHGRQPASIEAAAHFGLSKGTIWNQLEALEKKGRIRLTGKLRAVQFVGVKFRRVIEGT